MGVSIWQYASGAALPLAGVLLIVLLSADFFIPLRQLGSFFHVAMNGMTSTKRIFALLDTPIPAHGMQEMPEFGASDNGVDVCFDDVSFRYVDVNTDAAAAVSVTADTAVTADMETGKTGQIGESPVWLVLEKQACRKMMMVRSSHCMASLSLRGAGR